MSVRGREKGQFSSQTVPNPREQLVPPNAPKSLWLTNKEVQAIHTLWSVKRVDNQVQLPFDNHLNSENLNKQKEKEITPESIKKDDKVVNTQEKTFVPRTPFSQRLQANRKNNQM